MKKWIVTIVAAAALPLAAHSAEIKIGFQKGSGLLSMIKAQGSMEKALVGHQVKWIEFPAGPQTVSYTHLTLPTKA